MVGMGCQMDRVVIPWMRAVDILLSSGALTQPLTFHHCFFPKVMWLDSRSMSYMYAPATCLFIRPTLENVKHVGPMNELVYACVSLC
jgi:hypothetical protein